MSPLERRRAEYLFAFGHILHYTPTDVDRLTLDEFESLCTALDRYLAEMKRGAG